MTLSIIYFGLALFCYSCAMYMIGALSNVTKVIDDLPFVLRYGELWFCSLCFLIITIVSVCLGISALP